MGKKRTTLPPDLAAEWADKRTIAEVNVNNRDTEWRCLAGSGHPNYKKSVSHRLTGSGCALCANSARSVTEFARRRPSDEVGAITRAVKAGLPFAQFYAEIASNWDRGDLSRTVHRTRLQNLYSYYAYRARGDARFVNEPGAKPDGYTPEQSQIAARCAARGLKFAEFWEAEGRKWDKPMYRLRNWYRWKQKNFRDVRATSPGMSAAEIQVAAMAAADRVRPTQS